jgi:hypothetical protein
MMRLLAGFIAGTVFGMYVAAAYPNQLRDAIESLLGAVGK